MLEAVEKLLKDYKKNLQKTLARSMAQALLQKKETSVKKVKRSGETEAESAKGSISSATNGLEKTIGYILIE